MRLAKGLQIMFGSFMNSLDIAKISYFMPTGLILIYQKNTGICGEQIHPWSYSIYGLRARACTRARARK